MAGISRAEDYWPSVSFVHLKDRFGNQLYDPATSYAGLTVSTAAACSLLSADEHGLCAGLGCIAMLKCSTAAAAAAPDVCLQWPRRWYSRQCLPFGTGPGIRRLRSECQCLLAPGRPAQTPPTSSLAPPIASGWSRLRSPGQASTTWLSWTPAAAACPFWVTMTRMRSGEACGCTVLSARHRVLSAAELFHQRFPTGCSGTVPAAATTLRLPARLRLMEQGA